MSGGNVLAVGPVTLDRQRWFPDKVFGDYWLWWSSDVWAPPCQNSILSTALVNEQIRGSQIPGRQGN